MMRHDETPSVASQGRAEPAQRSVIWLNGERVETEAKTLAQLIALAGYGDARIATAMNGVFVAARARADTVIDDGDRVEIVAPRQGG